MAVGACRGEKTRVRRHVATSSGPNYARCSGINGVGATAIRSNCWLASVRTFHRSRVTLTTEKFKSGKRLLHCANQMAPMFATIQT